MAIIPEANAKKGNIPFSSKRKIRPIVRDQWTDEKAASALFAQNQDDKLLKGPNAPTHSIGGDAVGRRVGSGLGGGTFSPANPTAHNAGNLGTT